MEHILSDAIHLAPQITAYRRWLHQHPGVAFELDQTVSYVRSELEKMGYEPVSCGKSGLLATICGKKPGKTFLLRADMDALPMTEESGDDFSSTNGAMHACGHDLHTAMLLGAAKLLKDREEDICGTVKLMFQPAEEVFEGAKDMIAHGVLENPHPDAALMVHVTAALPLPAGTFIVCAPGVSAPAADYFTINVQGKGCHGSAPHNGIDAITAASHILLALQEINARELPAGEEAVLTVGTFHGGTASNVIADSAQLGGTIRTYNENTRSYIKERMTQIAQSIAIAYRASAEVSFGSGCPTLVNDKNLSCEIQNILAKTLKPGTVLSAADLGGARGGGSEDFAYVSQEVPALMLALAAGEPSKGYIYPQHHPKVRFDESVLPIGAAALAAAALGWLQEHQSA